MDSILFSANPGLARMSDVLDHLRNHNQLYFEVKFPIRKDRFSFPIAGFVHISGEMVRYVTSIEDILPFSTDHYQSPSVAQAVKPARWLHEWRHNINNIRHDHWKNALVISRVDPFTYDTLALKKYDGMPVAKAPQSFTRILPPPDWRGFR